MDDATSSSSATPSTNTPRLVVPTHGLTFTDWAFAAMAIGLYPFGVVFATLFSGSRQLSSWPWNAEGLGLLFLVLYVLIFALTSVRSVELTQSGVEFRFVFHAERRVWEDLDPPSFPASHGVWGVYGRRRDGRASRQRGFRLTVEQAHALVTYPACPRWLLSPAVAASLGLGATPS